MRLAQKTNFFFSYFFVWIVCFISQSAYAEFRSVAFAKTIPLEIIVNLGDWLKVRDPYGTLSWAESKNLQSKRMVIVKVDKANIYKDPESKSALVATIEKDVVIELSDPLIANGWIKVRYQQDLDGYIQTSQVWGI